MISRTRWPRESRLEKGKYHQKELNDYTVITEICSIPEEQFGELQCPAASGWVLDDPDLLVQEAPRGCVQLSLDLVLRVHSDRRTRPRATVQGKVDPRVKRGQGHLGSGIIIRELLLSSVRVTLVPPQHPMLDFIQIVNQTSDIVGVDSPKSFYLLRE